MAVQRMPLKTYASVPWLIAFCALMSSVANLTMGIVLLALSESGGDVALGVLTLVFALWGMVGSILALVFIVRQNRYNRSQARFIAQVSHELRTPLTSIRMYADTLTMRRYGTEEDQVRLLEHMVDEIARLEALTEQILEARQKKSPKAMPPVSLEGELMSTLHPFLEKPQYKGRIHVSVEGPLPGVRVDSHDFRSVVSNLVQNALIHGGEGEVQVSLTSREGRCVLSVRDHGKGIDASMVRKLLEPFARGADTTDSGIPGFGLGLSIVKDFCKRYGARLDVDKHPEGGAVFSVAMKVV